MLWGGKEEKKNLQDKSFKKEGCRYTDRKVLVASWTYNSKPEFVFFIRCKTLKTLETKFSI